MIETQAVAISPDRSHVVVKRGNNYAVVDRKKGITKGTRWGTRTILSSMRVKGDYQTFKEPIEYKGPSVQKSRKAVSRVDNSTTTDKKRTKKEKLLLDLGIQNFKEDLDKPYIKSLNHILDIVKAGKAHIPEGAERNSYTTPSEYGVIHIPVNRLKQVYQTDEALNPKKIKAIRELMRENKPLDPVEIGYAYDVHDGHHRWHAAIGEGYTHVPCIVVGKDPEKVKEAKKMYRRVWKGEAHSSEVDALAGLLLIDFVNELKGVKPTTEKVFEKGELSLVLDLQKSKGGAGGRKLNTSRLVQRRVAVRGKNGIFYRMQWVDPRDKNPNIQKPKQDEPDKTSYSSHDEGIREMERRQSTRFPIRHQKIDNVSIREHNYRVDREKLAQAERDLKAGKKLPPIRVNTDGEVIDNHHLLDLARKHGFSHIPIIVLGNPMLKKKIEEELKDRVYAEDEDGEETLISGKEESKGSDGSDSSSEDIVQSVLDFKNFTIKKYPKDFLMKQAKNQGIVWNEYTKAGKKLPANSSILWMRAHQAIVNHLSEGNTFAVAHDERQVDRKMEQSGQDSIHKHFLKLLEKHGSKDALMDFARDRGIHWKEKKDPLINWMYATMAIKKELSKGVMIDGIRTRQKGPMREANTEVTDQIRSMVTAYGKRHGKSLVMRTAKDLGIEFVEFDKKGNAYPQNSRILWMNAHQAIARYIAQGNEFKIGEDTGNSAVVGEFGGVTLTDVQSLAVNLGKRHSHNLEERSRNWAVQALSIDRGVSTEEAERLYEKFRENARQSKLMMHIDPFEMLPNGSMLLEELTSEGIFKNDFLLGRGMDRDAREVDERDLFGSEYDEATDEERPHYGVIDLMGQGLGANPFDGEVAFVMKDEVRQRSTGIHMSSSSIPYGEETNWTRSLDDPHHLVVDRWMSRWKEPKNQDKQRARLMDAIIDGTPPSDESDMFEAQVHGGIDLRRDVDYLLVPQSWQNSSEHSDMREALEGFAGLMDIQLRYEG